METLLDLIAVMFSPAQHSVPAQPVVCPHG